MKTLKFFLTCLVVMTFFGLASYSQGNEKTTYYWDSGEIHPSLPGVSEAVTGSYSGIYTVWDFKYQWRANGTYTGDISGTVYYTSAVEQCNGKDWMPGSVVTCTLRIHVQDKNGTLYYTEHHIYHQTINANGELTSDVYKEFILP
ncbi:MAG: hypothetical protein GYA41_11480 [Bacteroidales bacterium]|nr:hypothetical protein [Bacteroidales bacterium]